MIAALCIGCHPSSSREHTFSPFVVRTSHCASSRCPLSAATWRGSLPSFVRARRSARWRGLCGAEVSEYSVARAPSASSMTSATGATSPEEARELHVAGIHLRRDGRVMRVMGLAQEGGVAAAARVQGGARYSGVQRCPTVFRRRAHVRSGLQQPFSRAEVVVEAGVVQWLPAVLVSSGYLRSRRSGERGRGQRLEGTGGEGEQGGAGGCGERWCEGRGRGRVAVRGGGRGTGERGLAGQWRRAGRGPERQLGRAAAPSRVFRPPPPLRRGDTVSSSRRFVGSPSRSPWSGWHPSESVVFHTSGCFLSRASISSSRPPLTT